MKFDEKRQYVQEKRRGARKAGCKSCKKQTLWLILEGGPSLFDMLRNGASKEDLDRAMWVRGWYCRACIAERARRAQSKVMKVHSQTALADAEKRRCEGFMTEVLESGSYQRYVVAGLTGEEYVDRMMGFLLDKQAANVEEAFFLVGAAEQNERSLVETPEGE